MRKALLFVGMLLATLLSHAQPKTGVARPKLVVGMVVDQMRWDYLYRFYDRYSSTGFRRLLQEGFSCENTFIPYAQTVTAAGHTCLYTGSVPALHGIMGNEWFDKALNKTVYCAVDDSVKVVGSNQGQPMSPKNLWATTICDELRLATNFRSKVIGIAIKDRGAILPAGHSATAAYWYDGTSGNWITSTYYMQNLPAWVTAFNTKKWVDSFYRRDWNTVYRLSTYVLSDSDNVAYEGKFGHETAPVFPHELKSRMGKDYNLISSTPYGNTLTLNFARDAVTFEGLGRDAITDFLAISLSSPDYVGHQFGLNSVEEEDTYLRLDKDISDFLGFLDRTVGRGQYLFFLSADHGVAHVPGYMKAHKLPGEALTLSTVQLAREVEQRFNVKAVIRSSANYQFYLNDSAIAAAGAERDKVAAFIVDYMNRQPEVLIAFDNAEIADANLPAPLKQLFVNGFNTKRGGDIQVVLKPGSFYWGNTGTTHGTWYPYDSHIPLVWFGWNIKPGKSNREVYMTDVAPTIAAMLHIQMPSASIGHVITEISH